MDGAVQIIPNKFVYYRVYDDEVFLLADDVATLRPTLNEGAGLGGRFPVLRQE